MRFLDTITRGRVKTLPFWFTARIRALTGWRDWPLASAGYPTDWGFSGPAVVQSSHMEFMGPGASNGFGERNAGRWSMPASATQMPERRQMSFFAEAPGRDNDNNDPSQAGPVLVMPPAQTPRRPHRWLHRVWLVVFVLFCLEVGIILTVLPWTKLWTENSLLLSFPAAKEFLNYNFVRGLVSGLGLVDIWMGVAEAVTYRETPRT